MRRNYLINPKFQFTLVAWMLGISMISILMICAADLYFFSKYTQLALQAGIPMGHPFFAFLSDQHRSMNRIAAVVFGMVLIVGLLSGLLMSHRIAGPIYRICKHAQKCTQEENYTPVTLRKGDFFPELAEAFNKIIAKL